MHSVCYLTERGGAEPYFSPPSIQKLKETFPVPCGNDAMYVRGLYMQVKSESTGKLCSLAVSRGN